MGSVLSIPPSDCPAAKRAKNIFFAVFEVFAVQNAKSQNLSSRVLGQYNRIGLNHIPGKAILQLKIDFARLGLIRN
jgi:hypothetical protein